MFKSVETTTSWCQWKLSLMLLLLYISGSCAENQTNAGDVFPKPPVCGSMAISDKPNDGREAELGEFPWLANLEYRTEKGELEDGCAGTILTERFVITSGHCVKDPIEQKLGKLESLRVGDHNTAKELDCDDVGCLDPFQRLRIEQSIVHENYQRTQKVKTFYDIALLKTAENIIFTFSVAPICLPEVLPLLKPPVENTKLTIAGWGHDGTEKRIMDISYIENNACRIGVVHTQICAGAQAGQDSCIAESGSGLGRRTPQAWVLEGIVSYGYRCGSNKPVIFTRLRSFLPWIHEKIEKNMNATFRSNTNATVAANLTATVATFSNETVVFSNVLSDEPINSTIFALTLLLYWLSL